MAWKHNKIVRQLDPNALNCLIFLTRFPGSTIKKNAQSLFMVNYKELEVYCIHHTPCIKVNLKVYCKHDTPCIQMNSRVFWIRDTPSIKMDLKVNCIHDTPCIETKVLCIHDTPCIEMKVSAYMIHWKCTLYMTPCIKMNLKV